jgi:hypothetical protein
MTYCQSIVASNSVGEEERCSNLAEVLVESTAGWFGRHCCYHAGKVVENMVHQVVNTGDRITVRKALR